MQIDWTQVILAIITALPPTLLALATLLKCFRIETKADHIERLANGGVTSLGTEIQRLHGIIADLQTKSVSAATKRGDVHGPSAGDSYR